MRFTKLLALAAVVIGAFGLSFPATGFGIGLQPTTVEMQIAPGERQRQVITIANVHTEKPIALTLGLADWSLDEDGKIQLAPPGDMDRSAAEWVRFSPAFVELRPGESQQVVVDMVAPTRIATSGDHRFALLASTILPEDRAGESGVWRKYQIASLFYLNVGPSESAPRVMGAELIDAPNNTTEVLVVLGNDGDAHARLAGEVEIKKPDGQSFATAPVNNLVVLDSARRNLVLTLPVRAPDDAIIEVRLENSFAPQTDTGLIVMEPVLLSDLPRSTKTVELQTEAEE